MTRSSIPTLRRCLESKPYGLFINELLRLCRSRGCVEQLCQWTRNMLWKTGNVLQALVFEVEASEVDHIRVEVCGPEAPSPRLHHADSSVDGNES